MVPHLGHRAEVAQVSKLFPRLMGSVPYFRAVGYSTKLIVTISLEEKPCSITFTTCRIFHYFQQVSLF